MAHRSTMLTTLPPVIEALGGNQFPPALLAFVRSIANFDSAVIMAYPENSALEVVYNALHPGDQAGFNAVYQDHLWLLSPLYLSAKAGIRGFFHIVDIAPKNFRHSEYYKLYYHSNGVLDQVAFLLEAGDGTPVALSLERTPNLRRFSKSERARLAELTETLTALVRRQWPDGLTEGPATTGVALESSLHLHVENLLNRFGSSVLTPRERQVVQLLLKGYPSKLAAQQLGISTQTEQVHRKHIYQKLGLSSHGELFSLFFDALVDPGLGDRDPLQSLLQHSDS